MIRTGKADIQSGKIAFHPVLRDIHTPLNTAVRRGHLREISQFLFIQFPHAVLQKLLLRNIHENTVEILFTARFRQQLCLDGDPFNRSVPADQTVLIVNRIAVCQLSVQTVCHLPQVIGINHGSHGIAHLCKLFPGISKELKQTVIGINHRKFRIKTAPEYGAWNVIIKAQYLFPCLLLGGNIDTDRHDRRPAVFRRHHTSLVMDPDIRAVALFHPVLDHILIRIFQLTGHLAVYHLPVRRMHAVGNQPANILKKGIFILIAQIIQHPPVDKVKRKSFLYVSPHHAARQRIVQKLLTLFCQILHDKRLRIVLRLPLLAAGLCEMKAFNQPRAMLPHQDSEAAQQPGIQGIF